MKTPIMCAFALSVLLSACTRMEQFYPSGKKVAIDGEEFVVIERGKGNYLSVPNDPSKYNILTIDARAGARNVKAIEKATGCKVNRDSIQHQELNTIATVDC